MMMVIMKTKNKTMIMNISLPSLPKLCLFNKCTSAETPHDMSRIISYLVMAVTYPSY